MARDNAVEDYAMATTRKTLKSKIPVRKSKLPVRAPKPGRTPAKLLHSPNGKTPERAHSGKANGKGVTTAGLPPSRSSQQGQLEQERAQVLSELERLRGELLEAPELTGDEVDLNVYEREKTLGLVSAYERRLDEIEAARRAAEKGKYGICERCGMPIDPERLEIFPETRLCVKCKNQVEQQARRRLLK